MRRIECPIPKEVRQTLKSGEQVLLNGVIYTARDAAHKRMSEMLQRKEALPFDIRDAVIYYVGPTQTPPGAVFGSAGPTTSSRMDVYTPQLLDLGLGGMIGKGYRSEEVKEAIKRNHAVYFVALGGAGAILGQCVKKAECIAFEDLESEAIRRLEVEDLPVFVGIDEEGTDIYDE